jgi:transglutaminase-like putative cysteine protease
MPIDVAAHFSFTLERPSDVLLQFEAAAIPEQTILSQDTRFGPAEHTARVSAKDSIGERIWLRIGGEFRVSNLQRLEPHKLPGEAVEYLFDSRYVQADKLQNFVQDEFGHVDGGARIAAMRDWVGQNFVYTSGISTSETTALDTFVERRGVCRDYAHVMVGLARASAIPARFVSCYAPGVNPPDFHAVAEVFLADPTIEGGGAWHIADATGMADPEHTVKIGVGRDAADVSFMTVFGTAQFGDKDVSVTPVS